MTLSNKQNTAIFIIFLFHAVGLFGFLTPSLVPLFKQLVPFHLLLMAGIVGWFHKHWDIKNSLLFTALFAVGFIVEYYGVKTGVIFGEYQYGNTLGYAIAGIPLLIGLNWLLLVYSTSCVAHQLGFENIFTKAFISAGLMVLTDFFIEPIAAKYDYWHWKNDVIPHQNFVAWYIVSFVLALITHYSFKVMQNKTAIGLYIAQVLFFLMLNL